MVIGIIGENCSGKSTLAAFIRDAVGAELITGRDYLRSAGSGSEAERLFREKLKNAVHGSNIIYVIAEPEHLALLPEGSVRILVSCDPETIRERFKARMHGVLPEAVERMLERRHGMFDGGVYDLRYDGANGDPAALCEQLKELCRNDPGIREV